MLLLLLSSCCVLTLGFFFFFFFFLALLLLEMCSCLLSFELECSCFLVLYFPMFFLLVAGFLLSLSVLVHSVLAGFSAFLLIFSICCVDVIELRTYLV
jgi:hypothetical protein